MFFLNFFFDISFPSVKTKNRRYQIMKLIFSFSLTNHVYCVFAVFWQRSTRMCWAGSLQLWSSIKRPWCPAFPSSTCVMWPWWWDFYKIYKFIFNFRDGLCEEIAKKRRIMLWKQALLCVGANSSPLYPQAVDHRQLSFHSRNCMFLLGQQLSKPPRFLSVLFIALAHQIN